MVSNSGEQLSGIGYYSRLFQSQLATGEKRHFHALQQGETK